MACFNGQHDLIEIMQRPNHDAPDAVTVVRWCQQCGAIVVDVDVDGRTAPGSAMKMRLPAQAISSINRSKSNG